MLVGLYRLVMPRHAKINDIFAKEGELSVKQIRELLPSEPHCIVERNTKDLTTPFWKPHPNTNIYSFAKNALFFMSFEWLSWGNSAINDTKEQVIQEVTNFGILSALALSLNISIATVVDGNEDWANTIYFREILGIIFNISCSSFIISLLTSAFLLLLMNETPNGRAVNEVVTSVGNWFRVPGVSFAVGTYGFAGIIIVWIFHTFNIWISIIITGIFTFGASYAIMGSVTAGMISLYDIMSTYGILTITDDESVLSILNVYLDKNAKANGHQNWETIDQRGNKKNIVYGFRRKRFYEWILIAYDCCEFCDITIKRLDHVIDAWENRMAGIDDGTISTPVQEFIDKK